MAQTLTTMSPSILSESSAATVRLAERVARFSLRARGDLTPLSTALGVALPTKIGTRAQAGELQVICLGPDEWTLHAPLDAAAGIHTACAAVYETLPHALVEITAREVSLIIEGPRADELLTIGCPRDIDGIAVGEGRRTIFDGTTVVLWRDGAKLFRMDVWNSFAAHLLHLLEIGVKELAAEAA